MTVFPNLEGEAAAVSPVFERDFLDPFAFGAGLGLLSLPCATSFVAFSEVFLLNVDVADDTLAVVLSVGLSFILFLSVDLEPLVALFPSASNPPLVASLSLAPKPPLGVLCDVLAPSVAVSSAMTPLPFASLEIEPLVALLCLSTDPPLVVLCFAMMLILFALLSVVVPVVVLVVVEDRTSLVA